MPGRVMPSFSLRAGTQLPVLYFLIFKTMTNKIYFAGSITGGRDDKEIYSELIKYLKKYGEVLSEHIGHPGLTNLGELGKTPEEVFDRDMAWLNEADVVVAEVTTPSLGVGFEIGRADMLNKKVLCLYRNTPGRILTRIISGNKKISVKTYTSLKNAFEYIDNFFEENA
jgi:nucleoside 2-deoxyribosyltransferase